MLHVLWKRKERSECCLCRCRHIKWSAGKQRRHPTLLQTPTLPTASKPLATCLFISAGTPLTDDEVLFCEAVGPARLDKHWKTGEMYSVAYSGGKTHGDDPPPSLDQINSSELAVRRDGILKRPVQMFKPHGGAAPGEERRGREKKGFYVLRLTGFLM